MSPPGAAADHGCQPAWSLMMMLKKPLATVSLALGLLLATGASGASGRQDAYVDLVDFPHQEANWDRFYALEDHLIRAFHDICGDTYCEGEYSNHIALQFRCSVHAASGTVHACSLVIGAGNLEVDGGTGQVVPDSRTWACATPLGANTPVEALHAVLALGDPLRRPLPGSGRSMHDALIDCLN
ncbi:MAG: hypothetical protein ABS955_09900 [Stenotrophomonas maltophilia]